MAVLKDGGDGIASAFVPADGGIDCVIAMVRLENEGGIARRQDFTRRFQTC